MSRNTYTHGELIDDLYQVLEEANQPMSKAAIDRLLKEIFSTWEHALSLGKAVKILGIGTLVTLENKPRLYHNPHTGDSEVSSGSTTVRIRPYASLKSVLNDLQAANEKIQKTNYAG